uniref:cysteine--tRNA ligase n=1 Tax=Cuerna arida TaxID=1464854 RepID=A0A1B6FV68_9HEMI
MISIAKGCVLHKTNNILVKKVIIGSLVFCQNFAGSCIALSETVPKPASHSKWHEPIGYDSDILIYNPLIKQKSKLLLQVENTIKWYSCGPTVYDSAHIGHASCYVKLDIIRRILTSVFNLDVFYLMGITDIDDKIILRSNEAKEDFQSLAERYKVEFFNDLEKLNVLPPTMTVKVSDHIPDIISFIEKILEKGHAYVAPSGSVYFAVEGFPSYGKLRPPQLSESPEKPNPEKRSPLDFTLWKAAKAGEPKWNSPWAPGRPGWHIECSAMASKVLGPRLDIHSGGQDLVFPHHQNEEAQSCAYHNTSQWVNYWLHTGHLSVKGDVKMSKSLKNTVSISQLLEKYSSNHFRMLCLLSPYRNSIEYSEETMGTAVGNCRRVESFLDECELYLSGVKRTGSVDEVAVIKMIQDTKTAVRRHLADDFDTPRAIDEVLRFVSAINTMLGSPSSELTSHSVVAIASASNFVKNTLTQLGFSLESDQGGREDVRKLTSVLDATVAFRSSVREVALHPEMVKPRRAQLLKACDTLRMALSETGVEVKDHKSQKSTWSLKDVVQSDTKTD